MKISPERLCELRKLYNIQPAYKMVDTCGGEFDALSPYYYSTYEQYDEVEISDKKKSCSFRFWSYKNRSRYRV